MIPLVSFYHILQSDIYNFAANKSMYVMVLQGLYLDLYILKKFTPNLYLN